MKTASTDQNRLVERKRSKSINRSNNGSGNEWDPSMGDYEKRNSKIDNANLRKDQLKYKVAISLLVATIVLLFVGSIIYFSI